MSKTVKLTDWIFEIFSLQILWIIHIFKGFIVLGIFPSIAAVFAVVRHWLLKREVESLSYIFKQYYKENFKTANILGWFFFKHYIYCHYELYLYRLLSGTNPDNNVCCCYIHGNYFADCLGLSISSYSSL